jgi:hypothetical protein
MKDITRKFSEAGSFDKEKTSSIPPLLKGEALLHLPLNRGETVPHLSLCKGGFAEVFPHVENDTCEDLYLKGQKEGIYAWHASQQFNANLREVLRQLTLDVQQALGDNLTALILGGGYGRGEGGIVRINGVEQPYNDLDFTLVVKHKRAVPQDLLAAVCKRYEAILKVQVDFSRPLTVKNIRRWPHWLMWYDLLNGHVVLTGPPDILSAHAPTLLQKPLPSIEATRLLLNRGAGLLWAMQVVQGLEPPPDLDFVRRNYYKCALALGDALLIVYQRFATPYHGRDLRLIELTQTVKEVAALQLESLYHTALRFKFRPDEVLDIAFDLERLQVLAERWGLVFLHVEQLRTNHPGFSLTDYVKWSGLREPVQQPGIKRLRNWIQNGRLGTWSWRYPREKLYRQLPILLGLTEIPVIDWLEETARFLKIWHRFN